MRRRFRDSRVLPYEPAKPAAGLSVVKQPGGGWLIEVPPPRGWRALGVTLKVGIVTSMVMLTLLTADLLTRSATWDQVAGMLVPIVAALVAMLYTAVRRLCRQLSFMVTPTEMSILSSGLFRRRRMAWPRAMVLDVVINGDDQRLIVCLPNSETFEVSLDADAGANNMLKRELAMALADARPDPQAPIAPHARPGQRALPWTAMAAIAVVLFTVGLAGLGLVLTLATPAVGTLLMVPFAAVVLAGAAGAVKDLRRQSWS